VAGLPRRHLFRRGIIEGWRRCRQTRRPPPENEPEPDAETRAVIERAERAWQRQVEREERSFAYPGPMTRFRWILVAIAMVSVILLILQNMSRGG